jgi:hypothetical protein
MDKDSETYWQMTPARLRLVTTAAMQSNEITMVVSTFPPQAKPTYVICIHDLGQTCTKQQICAPGLQHNEDKNSRDSNMTAYSALSNRFTFLCNDTDTGDNPSTNQVITIKLALPVLDHVTGKTVEHQQLCKQPDYKVTWDRLYTDEVGRLCHGIGSHRTDKQCKHIRGTNTLQPIHFRDIPQERRGNVAHTRVVCEVQTPKADPNCTKITIDGNTIGTIRQFESALTLYIYI